MRLRITCMVGFCVFVLTGVGSANVPSDNFYMFPVVAKTLGRAGTDWRSELCVGNLSSMDLTVTIAYGNMDTLDGGYAVIPADETWCWDDLIDFGSGWTSFSGWLWVIAYEDDNEGLVVPFGASLRVYNWTSSGTYGVNVPPVNENDGFFGLEQYVGGVTGIHNFGVAGQSGFRTNVGVTSLEVDDPQQVAMALADDEGNIIWEYNETLEPLEQRQFGIPRSVSCAGGALAMLSDGYITGYVTVVDNRTGDGVYRMPIQFDIYDFSAAKGLLKMLPEPRHEPREKRPAGVLKKLLPRLVGQIDKPISGQRRERSSVPSIFSRATAEKSSSRR